MTQGFLLNYNYVISKAQIFSPCKNSKRCREDRSVATILFLFLAPIFSIGGSDCFQCPMDPPRTFPTR